MKVPVDYFGTEFTQVIVLKGKNCATIRHFKVENANKELLHCLRKALTFQIFSALNDGDRFLTNAEKYSTAGLADQTNNCLRQRLKEANLKHHVV